jgi:predicted metal-dependent phosphoesterase TrpH
MLYDFHIHTREYSDCSISSAEEICLKAVEAGLAGIALTEHDVWWPAAETKRLQEKFSELTILRGIEYACPEGHFLVFLPEPEKGNLPAWCSVLDLIPLVHHYDGVVIWAHPFRFDDNRPDWMDHVRPDGMEVASSNMHRQSEIMAKKVAAERGLMTFCNSDAHHVRFLGSYVNKLDISLTCVEDFVTYLRNHAHRYTTRCYSPMGATL